MSNDYEVIEDGSRPTTAVAIHSTGQAMARRDLVAGMLRPVAPVDEVIGAQNEVRNLVARALQEDRDYGKIPGTDKATLLKPGAERINAAYGLGAEYRVTEKEVDHDREVKWNKVKWITRNVKPSQVEADTLKEAGKGRWRKGDGDAWVWQDKNTEDGLSLGLYRYVVECRLVHRASGVVVGQGIGSCSSMESKYIDRPRDSENTILKMACKRAYIAATLNTHGLSDQFTQDMEDFAGDREHGSPDPSPAGSQTSSGGSARRSSGQSSPPASSRATDIPSCPECSGPMWDNRPKKASGQYKATAADFACKDKQCGGKVWPPKDGESDGGVAELDRLVAATESAIRELSGLDAGAADLAKQSLNEIQRGEQVKPDQLRRLQTRVQQSIDDARAFAAVGAPAGDDFEDFNDDLPF